MSSGQPGPPPLAVALTVIAGLAVCAIAAAVMVPDDLGVGAWPVAIVGAVVLFATLAGLWCGFRRRDRTLW